MAMDEDHRRRRGGSSSLADINITPLVDVLLVLLIIFMVTAPMIHHGASIPTPDVSPGDSTDDGKKDEKDTVVVDQKGVITLRGKTMTLKELYKSIKDDAKLQKSKELYIKAHLDLAYGKVMEVIGTVRRAGIKKLGVVVDTVELQLPPLPKDQLPATRRR